MSYLDQLSKNIKRKRRKQKNNSADNVIIFTVIGLAVGGIIAGIVARKCMDEIENIIINNANNVNEETDNNSDEIKQTVLKTDVKSVGDVGVAMEKALEDLEDEEYKENEEKK
ncbi:MAG: hypothetical protein ACREVX_07775 [Clostridium sp.]|uniref:hypothetical protein n=1 Tax=Clostridium sp. TaxID=1506 RepID=UPI003D6CB0C0